MQTVEPEGECPQLKKLNIAHPMQKLIINRNIVLKILKNLKPDKAHGIDDLSPRILRELAEEIVDVIVELFISSLDSEMLPQDWLRSLTAVIFKKGKKNLVGNYRPISLTCVLCKCLETIIRDHTINHMKRNNLFSKYQYGFISGRSVSLQLLYVLENWTEALEKGYDIDCVYGVIQ